MIPLAIERYWRMRGFEFGPEMTEFDRETLRLALPYTMTSPLRLQALIKAVRYIVRYQIPGAIVECGVWKGGSMLAAARTLVDAGDDRREMFLYDTFSGMPEPDAVDIRIKDAVPASKLIRNVFQPRMRAKAPLECVEETMLQSRVNPSRLHYIVGRVEDTLPTTNPEKIAILRLDTDWYSSTIHELMHFFPRLSHGGVLLIDDYGWWDGAKKAVDEYFTSIDEPILLHVIDDVGRIATRSFGMGAAGGTND